MWLKNDDLVIEGVEIKNSPKSKPEGKKGSP